MVTTQANGSVQTGRMVARAGDDDDGLRIALSAPQLAAVLERETLEAGGTIGNRLIGGLRLLGCGAEFVGATALLAAPEPTMLTKVGGVALAVHASDQCSTGVQQIWTGRDMRSLTERTATSVARGLGAGERTAENVGVAVEILVPIGAAALAGAIRTGAVRAGRISLERHEAKLTGNAALGHTIDRHVGWSAAQMRARLVATAAFKPPPKMISTFPDIATAERSVTRVLQVRKTEIAAWVKSGAPPKKDFILDLGKVVGEGVDRASGQLVQLSQVKVVLRRAAHNGKLYFIVTAHPM